MRRHRKPARSARAGADFMASPQAVAVPCNTMYPPNMPKFFETQLKVVAWRRKRGVERIWFESRRVTRQVTLASRSRHGFTSAKPPIVLDLNAFTDGQTVADVGRAVLELLPTQ
jgi:hypothetical protein